MVCMHARTHAQLYVWTIVFLASMCMCLTICSSDEETVDSERVSTVHGPGMRFPGLTRRQWTPSGYPLSMSLACASQV